MKTTHATEIVTASLRRTPPPRACPRGSFTRLRIDRVLSVVSYVGVALRMVESIDPPFPRTREAQAGARPFKFGTPRGR